MNHQEAFDKAVAHLRKQGAKAHDSSRRTDDGSLFCAYRGDNGMMCAVGCLITDEEYTKSFEGRAASWLQERLPAGNSLVFLDGHFLEGLQSIHDNSPPEQWEDQLKNLAIDYKLKYNGVEA